MLIDSHCHLDGEEYATDRAAVLERAAAAGVGGILAVGGGAEPGTLGCGVEVAEGYDRHAGMRIWAMVGVHPHEAARLEKAGWEELEALAGHARVVGIGEIGLDYHYDRSLRAVQRRVFERQLGLAGERGLPAAVHCREAFADCLEVIAAQNPPGRGVFHCFNGTREEAERVLELGWYLSFSGMLTFNKADGLRAVAAWAPRERILVETDAPFLAPAPHRGKRNEPAWVAEAAAKLAELRGVERVVIEAETGANFFRLFPRAQAGGEAPRAKE